MNTYLLIKWSHILSSVLLVGTGFGTAFYLYFANRSRNVAAQAVVSRLVVRADWWFTTPAAIYQPISGLWMAHMAGWPLNTTWIAASLGLYILSGALWLPVVKMQLDMARIAEEASRKGATELPPRYWQLARRWEWCGYPAFVSMLVTYGLMVFKPA
ncbi:DUF2269 domain-containing protein [Hydrogenophaga sp. 5NK40-0174]|uniref:DUF2269 family protein n=1 Tax=Hydrogenophaga sp. 5NK40-0174 TaxID=3127649 RepID=UPI003105DA06